MRPIDDAPFANSAFLLAALEQAKDAVVIVAGDGRVKHVNTAAARLWDLPKAAMVGHSVERLGLDLAASAGETAESCIIRITHQDGRHIRAEQSLSRVPIAGETAVVAFVRDVTAEADRRERLALMSLVADRTNRAVIVTDRRLRIVYTNAAFAAVFGHTPQQAIGQRAIRLLAGRHTDPRAVRRLQRDAGHEQEILAYAKGGDEVWVSATTQVFRNERGRAKFVFTLLTDIGETRQLRSLQQLILGALADELPLAEIADQLCRRVEVLAPDVVCSVLHVDAAGLVHPLGGPSLPDDFSRTIDGAAVGPDVGSCGTAAYLGEPVLARDIATDPRWAPFKELPLAAGLSACWSTPIKGKDGRVIGTFAFYFRESRGPSRWHQRITQACVQLCALAIERKEARAQIARLAYYDLLTGLPNRAQLRQMIDQVTGSCPAGHHVALLFLDLDHFKDVNDTLGHSAGDDLLVGLTQRLRGEVGPEGLLGRLGGDEFVIVLPDSSSADASRAAARITAALASPFKLGARHVPMSASIGFSIYPDNASDIDTLMQQADAAMYQAKQAGRGTHRLFSADMNRLAEQRLVLSGALRNAIAHDALRLFYQPQIRMSDGAIQGAEALTRWHDGVLGEVSPGKFIPLAEECGLIEQIGQWSIREACRQLAAWRRAGLDVPCVSVNLSPINFQNANLAGLVAEVIAANGLPPQALMLEITESVIMNERSAAIETMTAIRELGVGLSLDDFGTGYSSLSRLAHLPIRELKIDRGFMHDIEHDASALAIATAVVRVGQSLNMTVVAEGVESEGQRNLLASLGCDVAQGFLYSPALAPDAFEKWLLGYSAARAGVMLRRVAAASSPQPLAAPKRMA